MLMSNLILKINLLIVILVGTPALSGVGDVYYCVMDTRGHYSVEDNYLDSGPSDGRFIIKQSSDFLEFEESSKYQGFLSMYPYEVKSNNIIVSTEPSTHRIWFDGNKLTYIISQSEGLDHFLIFATCTTF